MSYIIIQDVVFILLMIGLSIPLGIYIYKVMAGQKVFLSRLMLPLEKGIYKIMGIKDEDDMSPKDYAAACCCIQCGWTCHCFWNPDAPKHAAVKSAAYGSC